MTVEQKIYSLWSADGAATALVPAARFKPAGLYQNIALPYVVAYPVAEQVRARYVEGVSSLRRRTYQFTVVAADADEALPILAKLRDVFDGNSDGFDFFHRGERFVDAAADGRYVTYASDFLITSTA